MCYCEGGTTEAILRFLKGFEIECLVKFTLRKVTVPAMKVENRIFLQPRLAKITLRKWGLGL